MTKPVFKGGGKRQFYYEHMLSRRTVGSIWQLVLMITTLPHACKMAATLSHSTSTFKKNRGRGERSK